ncbi:MAG: glutathione S-transferase [Rhodospirillales bacterium]|jgi:glutathione S-transferase|nr:glutathione S-transferase [Rhodospirillales bacterium]
MKLCYSATSPYVRKVTMLAIETGLDSSIEHVSITSGPMGEIAKLNPLGKVPTLELDDGNAIYDSPVICEYLDGEHSGTKMIPENKAERLTVLRLQALADGAMDAGILRMLEGRRPENEQSPSWIERQQLAYRQSFDVMEASVSLFNCDVDLAQITFCAAIGWFDFRLSSEFNWREDRPALADWYAEFSARPSAMATEPQDVT